MKMPRPMTCPECAAMPPADHRPTCAYANWGKFDPGDPMDAMSELFRTQVTDLALSSYKITIYRDLGPQRQLECFVAGVLTGLVGVCLASVKPEGADAIMDYITECLPMARTFAESIKSTNGSPALADCPDTPREGEK